MITEYGLTKVFHIERGTEQGNTLLPALWCLFYDSLISYIVKKHKGFSLSVKTIKDLRNPEEKETISKNVRTLAFINDTVWIASSKTALLEILQDVNSFMTNSGIEVNWSKTDLLIIKPSVSKKQKVQNPPVIDKITINSIVIKGKQPDEPVQYLGAWLQINNKKLYTHELIESKLNFTTKMLKQTSIMNKQCKYIINAILFSQLLYHIMTYVSSQEDIEKWQAKIKATNHYNLSLSKSTPNSIIESLFGLKIGNLLDRIQRKVIEELTLGIENKSLYGQIFKIWVQQLQNKKWSINPIWSKEQSTTALKQEIHFYLLAK